MENAEKCPKCSSENIYHDGSLWICSECSYEFTDFPKAEIEAVVDSVIRDSNGVELRDGIGAMNFKQEFVKKV